MKVTLLSYFGIILALSSASLQHRLGCSENDCGSGSHYSGPEGTGNYCNGMYFLIEIFVTTKMVISDLTAIVVG